MKATVNSHFLERFAGAILQSALDVGVNLASRRANTAVILAVPGSLEKAGGSIAQPAEIKPTLTVPAGTSISVFVARDLDFSDARSAP